jgi:hypothetical protein
VTLRLRYEPPAELPAAPDAGAALYALADAGAAAVIELDGYALPVDGTGLAELHRQAERLLDVLDGGEPAPGDDDLRAELPGVPPDAVLHSWLFASYMAQLPVVVFAIDGPRPSSPAAATRRQAGRSSCSTAETVASPSPWRPTRWRLRSGTSWTA